MKDILDMHEELVRPLPESEIEHLIESDSHEAYEDHVCSELSSPDEVEMAIQGWVQKLIMCGYFDDDATRAVFDGLADLVETSQLTDTPDMDEPLHIKEAWVRNFNERIHAKLLSMGIDFTEPEALIDGNAVPTENWISLDSGF